MATVDRQQRLSFLGPNWFASVMGTGIVATAGATLPVHIPGMHAFCRGGVGGATVWLVMLIVAVAAHWLRHPTVARSHAYNPQMAPLLRRRADGVADRRRRSDCSSAGT